MKRLNNQFIIVAFVAVPIVVASLYLYRSHHIVQQELSRLQSGQNILDIEKSIPHQEAYKLWQKLPYEQVSAAGTPKDWSQIRMTSQVPISYDQYNKLLHNSYSLLSIFANAQQSEAYHRYISSRQIATCTIAPSDIVAWSNQMHIKSQNPVEVVTKVIQTQSPGQAIDGISALGSTLSCTEVSRTETPYTTLLQKPTWKQAIFPGCNKVSTWKRVFQYSDDFQKRYDNGETLKIADLRTYIHTSHGNVGEPALLRMWWCASAKEWRPLELVTDMDNPSLVLFLP